MFNPSTALLATTRVLVIGAMAATLARAIWFITLGPEPAQLVESAQPEASSGPDAMDIEQIAALNLFGAPPSAAGGFDAEDAPDTELDLELLGIFLANRPRTSVAIIGSRGDGGEAYSVSDPIFGNAKVAEIRRDIVLISRAGIMEALRFDDEPTLTATIPVPRAGFEQRGPADDAPLSASAGGVEMEDAVPEDFGESIDVFRTRFEKDPDGMLRAVGLEPVSVDGDTGYRVGQRAASRQLGRTGLQPGDTILSIDGQPISAVSQNPEAFGDLLSKGSARLEIRRGERRFFLTTSLSTLVALASMDLQPT